MGINSKGEREIKVHMKTVRKARKELKKEAGALKKDIGKKMTFALSQDKKVQSDMKEADKKCKKKK